MRGSVHPRTRGKRGVSGAASVPDSGVAFGRRRPGGRQPKGKRLEKFEQRDDEPALGDQRHDDPLHEVELGRHDLSLKSAFK